MILLNCPNCGPRNAAEFRFGGEYNPRPKNPLETPEAQWADYVYMRANTMGVQTEWWYHRSGCQLWFLARRDTDTNQVFATKTWEPEE